MVYEVYSQAERQRMTFRKAGIDIIDPSKETRRQKLGRKVRTARYQAKEQAKARVRAGIKELRGTPESRKARREKLFKKLKEKGRNNQSDDTPWLYDTDPNSPWLSLSPSEKKPSRRGRRRASRRQKGYPRFY